MRINEIARIKLSTNPSDYGAYVTDKGTPEKTIELPISKITVFEPEDKFSDPDNAKNLKKIVQALKAGKTMPPILVRRQGNKFQVLDGHHRFMAYKMLGKKSILARIIASVNVNENRNPGWREGQPGWQQKPEEKAYIVFDTDGNEVARFEYQHVWDSSPAMNKAVAKYRELMADYRAQEKAKEDARIEAKPLSEVEKRYIELDKSIKRYNKYIYPQTPEDDILDQETRELYMKTTIKWYEQLEKYAPVVRKSIINGTYKG